MEDFEGFIGPVDPLVVLSPFSLNGVTYTASVGDLALTSKRLCHDRTCLQHRYIFAVMEIAFSQPVPMAGTFVGAADEWATTVSFLADDLSELGSIDLSGDHDYLFAGWRSGSDWISRIRVDYNQLNEYIAMRIDDVRYVPEPISALLLAAGLAGLALRRRLSA